MEPTTDSDRAETNATGDTGDTGDTGRAGEPAETEPALIGPPAGGPRDGADADAVAAHRTASFVNTDQGPPIDDLFAAAARSAGVTVTDPGTGGTDTEEDGTDGGGDAPRKGFFRRHRILSGVGVVVVLALIYPSVTYVQALRKDGNESLQGRTAEWARDMKLGFLVDWLEQKKFSNDQFAESIGGTVAPDVFSANATPTTAANTTSTKASVPHLTPPARMASPIDPPAEGEGVWTPTGPLVDGLPAVYTTKVRPDTEHTGLTIFVAWVDTKLADVRLFPGTDLPGGTWETPHFITPELCPRAIMASNGGFRMDAARGGYYSEGREAFPLVNGTASLVLYKDGRVDVVPWGQTVGRDQLPEIQSVRQNLGLLVDNGQPTPATKDDTDWGAKLKNVYFMWRSAYGVTADGALVFIGGPALTPLQLAQALSNAGAVRAMEGDINPEWVTAILISQGAGGQCQGQKALGGPEDKGGMRTDDNRYLSTDTRDFIGVLAKQLP